jgi:hypothetical protein
VEHDFDLIRGLEEELFNQSTRQSPEAVDNLLADDFVEFGRSGGVYTKAEVIRSLATAGTASTGNLAARDYVLRPLADDTVLLTYRSFRFVEGREYRHTLRSSIWKFMGGRWRMIFHQGTPVDR